MAERRRAEPSQAERQRARDAPKQVARGDEAILAGEHGAALAAALQLAHHLHQLEAVGGGDLRASGRDSVPGLQPAASC